MAGRKGFDLLGSVGPDDNDNDNDVIVSERVKGQTLRHVLVSHVSPDPGQPRKDVSEEELDQLQAQIEAVGQLKPIDVYVDPDDDERFILEDGEMRWMVFSPDRLNREFILARVFTSKQEVKTLRLRQLLANIGRIDMSLMDVVNGLHQYKLDSGLQNKELAVQLGWSPTKLSRMMKLYDAPVEIQEESKRTTNINTLAYMTAAYKKDAALFARSLEETRAEDFSGNLEAFWRSVNTEMNDEPKEDKSLETVSLSEVRTGQSVSDPSDTPIVSDTVTDKKDVVSQSDRAGLPEYEHASDQTSPRLNDVSFPAEQFAAVVDVKSTWSSNDVAVLQLFTSLGNAQTQQSLTIHSKEMVDRFIDELMTLRERLNG
ncbi:ParB/RepB/Spo0J family partition protein [Enterovibrio paralichthyis]|uniref:ParB/RepB/Spo0J family partition protein n=1 Tax=Enterovibrio paralichthyis TaxID=2853805 RepID=UPI001C445B32|nr:ParB/RepB/Spo0J family partition protein [Enterovibrio paralichthyis]MBV7300257.1 ParB/RepB/Spo0J family partition protein [Enterovibrio paralichthyis]